MLDHAEHSVFRFGQAGGDERFLTRLRIPEPIALVVPHDDLSFGDFLDVLGDLKCSTPATLSHMKM